jgi:hypothetical protein
MKDFYSIISAECPAYPVITRRRRARIRTSKLAQIRRDFDQLIYFRLFGVWAPHYKGLLLDYIGVPCDHQTQACYDTHVEAGPDPERLTK